MTDLEHLIKNTFMYLEHTKAVEKQYGDVKTAIQADPNLPTSGITADQCLEICQYVLYDFIATHYKKIDKFFKTNREWLESLTDEEFAEWCTHDKQNISTVLCVNPSDNKSFTIIPMLENEVLADILTDEELPVDSVTKWLKKQKGGCQQ